MKATTILGICLAGTLGFCWGLMAILFDLVTGNDPWTRSPDA